MWPAAASESSNQAPHAELTLVKPAAPFRETGTIMVGTPAATPYYILHGAEPGPTVVVIGGVHGDEPAGYLAAEKLLQGQVLSGTLVLVPRSNVEAIRRNARYYGRNMNRLFPGKADGDEMERLAYQLWRLTADAKPSLVLTLHESRDFYREDRKRYGQTFTFDFPDLRGKFQRVLDALNPQIQPSSNRFYLKIEAFPTCPTYQSYKYLGAAATSIETSKRLPLEVRIRYQLQAVACFFQDAGLRYVLPGAPQPNSRPGTAALPLAPTATPAAPPSGIDPPR